VTIALNVTTIVLSLWPIAKQKFKAKVNLKHEEGKGNLNEEESVWDVTKKRHTQQDSHLDEWETLQKNITCD